MIRHHLRAILTAMAVSCLLSLLSSNSAQAAHPDIFYNYYVGPVYGVGQSVQLYVSPRPTPPMVGHTWITYPPLNPHEFLYHHHRKYFKYYRHGGFTTSCVRYH